MPGPANPRDGRADGTCRDRPGLTGEIPGSAASMSQPLAVTSAVAWSAVTASLAGHSSGPTKASCPTPQGTSIPADAGGQPTWRGPWRQSSAGRFRAAESTEAIQEAAAGPALPGSRDAHFELPVHRSAPSILSRYAADGDPTPLQTGPSIL